MLCRMNTGPYWVQLNFKDICMCTSRNQAIIRFLCWIAKRSPLLQEMSLYIQWQLHQNHCNDTHNCIASGVHTCCAMFLLKDFWYLFLCVIIQCLVCNSNMDFGNKSRQLESSDIIRCRHLIFRVITSLSQQSPQVVTTGHQGHLDCTLVAPWVIKVSSGVVTLVLTQHLPLHRLGLLAILVITWSSLSS